MTENAAREIKLDREQMERAEDLLAEIEQDPDAFAFEVIWLRDRLESLERAADDDVAIREFTERDLTTLWELVGWAHDRGGWSRQAKKDFRRLHGVLARLAALKGEKEGKS